MQVTRMSAASTERSERPYSSSAVHILKGALNLCELCKMGSYVWKVLEFCRFLAVYIRNTPTRLSVSFGSLEIYEFYV